MYESLWGRRERTVLAHAKHDTRYLIHIIFFIILIATAIVIIQGYRLLSIYAVPEFYPALCTSYILMMVTVQS